ncbi:uncharacterized protein KY384_008110 [Bacidia gigantensis]|uniref:uncharacterized protein n=1 Tax=Bacidia gigantensis TaxID=2732470 RepID=UPI001D044223|nr:uncharacterized protein KY384_008110 [Bacidia gigantensis]KAG8526681.1 hypothetical protein KY384_008110 [Bacidia gigantensis]
MLQEIEETKYCDGFLLPTKSQIIIKGLASSVSHTQATGSSRAIDIDPGKTVQDPSAGFMGFQDVGRQSYDFKYVAYYYFSFKDAARQNAKSMLRSLMLQVLCQQSSVPEAVLDIYDGHEHEQPSQEALLKAFKAIIAKSGQFYIILDALDECPSGNEERAKLLSMLTSFKKFDLPTLHILVTSRKELDLIDLEDLVTDPPVSIQNKDVNNDILLHVRMQLRSNPKLCGWPKEIKDEIESKLAGGSHGMFRWASCQLELLRKCLRASTVKQTLQTLPRTLDDTYDRILLNIDQTYRKEAILALMWLLYSERPLSLRQLAEAMVIDNSAEPAFSPDDRFFSPESALNILSSLVSFTRSTRSRGPLLEIHLAHYSVKEYLTSARVSEGPAACFGIRHAVAQEQIVRGCLHYLRCCVPSDALAAMSIESEEPLDAPLYLYAARTWFVHAKKCGECITEGTTEMIINILEEPSIWSPYYNPEALGLIRNHSFGDFDRYRPCEEEPKPSKSHSALYYAACLGINEVVRYLLRHGAVVDEEFGRFGNALQAASLKGHMPVVITLVQGGANVNLQGGLFESAINAACFGGYAEIVKYLIERGARVDCEGFLGSPLDTLSRSQNPSWEILTTLLQKGALSFAKEKTKSWLMRWAAISGQEEVVRLLIDKMDISKKTSFKFTINVARIGDHRSYQPKVSAPYEAVFRRHEAVVKLLVEKWSNIGEQDSEGRTALYWACFLQCNGIVQMLLDHGADVHRPGPNQWVGRYWAALFDNQETLRLLNRVCDPSSCARCTAAESNAKAENESILDSVLTIWHCMEETSKTINNDVVPDDKYPKPHLRFN